MVDVFAVASWTVKHCVWCGMQVERPLGLDTGGSMQRLSFETFGVQQLSTRSRNLSLAVQSPAQDSVLRDEGANP